MTDATPEWDPRQYGRFDGERDRAALDLLLRLPEGLEPREIWDLGCGAGQHAALLKRRHPAATVHGLDTSAAMLAEAARRGDDVDWVQGDIAGWSPARPADLIFSNAALHWLADHEVLMGRLVRALAPGGVLAVQMPMAHETRHHGLLRMVAGEGPWAGALAAVPRMAPLLPAETYYDVLAAEAGAVDIWATTYLHALTGPDAVLEWMKGTALRPYMSALAGDGPMLTAFLSALAAALSGAFPRRSDGVVLLPFPRLFLVARRR
jgi:trans-aconitate 2-methyltransferase